MSISLSEFLSELTHNPALAVVAVLATAVILVNGGTDAPNAIATCIATRAISPKNAVIMAAVFDFFGVFIMTIVNATVAETISKMVDFGNNSEDAVIALCAAMIAIVIWAVAAWIFGIPTSESHALIAGLTGASIAIHSSLSGINGGEWVKVLIGLLMSSVLGFGAGFVIVRLVEAFFKRKDRRKTQGFFKYAQIFGGAAMAFMHGAQDGQKFLGVFMLGIFLSKGEAVPSEFAVPIWLMVFCSAVMALGTSVGGYRIIKKVGMQMVKQEKYQGFSADIAAAGGLFVSSFFGIPVSTTHMKATAIMGVSASHRLSAVNWNVVKDMVWTWILTFPGCGAIAYIMVRLFLAIF